MELTPKQQKFCEEYVIDFNGKQAAIRSGYSKSTAEVQASRLLSNAKVKAYISKLQQELREKSKVTAEQVIEELRKVGFSNVQDFIKSGNDIKDLSKIDRNTAAAISSIKVMERPTEMGYVTTTEFKLWDKVTALQQLGKHLGVFEKDNNQKVIKIKVTTK